MRISRALCLAAALTLVPGIAFAGPWLAKPVNPEHAPVAKAVNGVYQIAFNLTIDSTLPANSTIVCKAAVTPVQSGILGEAAGTAPVETASSLATVNGGTGTCVVEIPFAWSLNNSFKDAALSFEVDAVNATGTLPVVVRASVQQGIVEAFPASGATSSLSFNLIF